MNVLWKCRSFSELTTDQLYDIMRLRQEVFIVEQTCYYLDADGKDQDSWHLMGYIDNELHAYSRLVPLGLSYSECTSIGRILTSEHYRNKGLGKLLMMESLNRIKEFWPNQSIKISAQSYLDKFYQHFGFINTGESYLEDGIPHQSMIIKAH